MDPNNPVTEGIMNDWGFPYEVPVHDKAMYQESSGPAQPENAKMVDTGGLATKFLKGQQFTKGDLPR